MIDKRAKSPIFEDHQIPTEGSDTLHARMMRPKPPTPAKRLVLIPPLVGASASQGLIIFRNLTRRGSILLSFEYRGHPNSMGTFELDKTVIDTRYAIRWAEKYARERGLPLHAFAICYGVVSITSQFRSEIKCPFWSFSTVSGLFSLDQIIRFKDFSPTFSKHVGVDLEKALQSSEIGEQVDWNGEAFRRALREYLTMLFPELRVGDDFFEELQYDRVNIRRTLLQLMTATYLKAVRIPRKLPCHVLYGINDDIMSLDAPQGREDYRKHALEVIPHAKIYEREIDHYGRGPGHDFTIKTVADIFEQSEVNAVNLKETADKPEEVTR